VLSSAGYNLREYVPRNTADMMMMVDELRSGGGWMCCAIKSKHPTASGDWWLSGVGWVGGMFRYTEFFFVG